MLKPVRIVIMNFHCFTDIDLSTFLKFNRIRALTDEVKVIADAIAYKSELLQVHIDLFTSLSILHTAHRHVVAIIRTVLVSEVLITELQIRGDDGDNSAIIFLISQ